MSPVGFESCVCPRAIFRLQRLAIPKVSISFPSTRTRRADGFLRYLVSDPICELGEVVGTEDIYLANYEIIGSVSAVWASIKTMGSMDFLGRGIF